MRSLSAPVTTCALTLEDSLMRSTRSQHEDEERSTYEGGDDTERYLGGGVNGPSAEGGGHDERRPAHDRDRHHDAVARVGGESDQVRHDDAHEADESTHRHGRGRAEGRRRDGGKSNSPSVDAKAAGFFFAEAKDVEQPTVCEQYDRTHHHVREDKSDVGPRGDGKTTQDPGVHRLEILGVLLLKECLRRGE